MTAPLENTNVFAHVSDPRSDNLDYSLYQATPLGVTVNPENGDTTFALLGGSSTDGGPDDQKLRVLTFRDTNGPDIEGFERLAEFFSSSAELSLVGEPGKMVTVFRDGSTWVTAPTHFRP